MTLSIHRLVAMCVLAAGAVDAQEGRLDGLAFIAELGPAGEDPDVIDRLEFEDGMFRSVECERTCNFGPQPYYTRTVGDGIEFVAELTCPDKDATLVWRGRVEDGEIAGVMHWRSERWYWSVERDFPYAGTRVSDAADAAGR